MRVLILCECSGEVREAFSVLGHDAWSVDLKPDEKDSPYHIQGDALIAMQTPTRPWDVIIMHPPCTYLSASGLHWNNRGRGWEKTYEALQFVDDLMVTATTRARVGWALENPIGIIGSRVRKADQYVQPYEFGEDASKKTGLWLYNLPPLTKDPMLYVPPRMVNGRPRWANQNDNGQNRLSPGPERAAERSRTYSGIARAMATQWGQLTV